MSVEAYEGLCCIMLARLSDLQHQMSEVKSKYRWVLMFGPCLVLYLVKSFFVDILLILHCVKVTK